MLRCCPFPQQFATAESKELCVAQHAAPHQINIFGSQKESANVRVLEIEKANRANSLSVA
jgi:hypothetical protein